MVPTTLHNTYLSVAVLTKMFTDDTHKNVHISTGDGTVILTHSAVLAALSEKLSPLFAGNSACTVVKLNTPGVTCTQWQVILELVYTGRVSLPRGFDLHQLKDTCKLLDMPQMVEFLKEHCDDSDDEADVRRNNKEDGEFNNVHGHSVVSFTLDKDWRFIRHEDDSTSRAKMGRAVSSSIAHQEQFNEEASFDVESIADETDANNNESSKDRNAANLPTRVKTRSQTDKFSVSRSKLSQSKQAKAQLYMRLTCGECQNESGSVHEAAQHLKAAHGEHKCYRCRVCNKAFASYVALNAHCKMRCFSKKKSLRKPPVSKEPTKIGGDNLNRSSSSCGKSPALKDKPGMGKDVTDANTSSCMDKRCGYCGKMSDTFTAAAKHIKTVHRKKDCYICRLCGMAYMYLSSLYHHYAKCKKIYSGKKSFGANANTAPKTMQRNKKHVPIDGIKCHKCGKISHTLKSAAEHLRNIHRIQDCYVCSVCGVGYRYYTSLQTHQYRAKCMKNRNATKSSNKSSLKDSNEDQTLKIEDFAMNRRCSFCNNVSDSVQSAADHLKTAHGVQKCFICKRCGKGYMANSALGLHFRKRCTGSRLVASDKHTTRNNNDEKRGDDIMDTKCNLCGKISDCVKSAARHHKTVHRRNKCFICVKCGTGYELYQSLKMHFKSKCGRNADTENAKKSQYSRTLMHDTMNKKCNICSNVSDSIAAAANHLREKHQVAKCYVCKHCNIGYRFRYSLSCHYKICAQKRKTFQSIAKTRRGYTTDVMDKKCHKCGKASESIVSAAMHLQKVHRQKNCYICKRCGASFCARGMLYKHCRDKCLRSRKLPPSPRKFQLSPVKKGMRRNFLSMDLTCYICRKKSGTNASAAHHLKSVHGVEKCYICVICKKGYSERTGLYGHFVKCSAGGKVQSTSANSKEKISEKQNQSLNQSLSVLSQQSMFEIVQESGDENLLKGSTGRIQYGVETEVGNTASDGDIPQVQTKSEPSYDSENDMPQAINDMTEPDSTLPNLQPTELSPTFLSETPMPLLQPEFTSSPVSNQKLKFYRSSDTFQPQVLQVVSQNVQPVSNVTDISAQAVSQIYQTSQTLDNFPLYPQNSQFTPSSTSQAGMEDEAQISPDSGQDVKEENIGQYDDIIEIKEEILILDSDQESEQQRADVNDVIDLVDEDDEEDCVQFYIEENY